MNTLCPLPGRDLDRITRLGPDTLAARLEQGGATCRAELAVAQQADRQITLS
jgi:hypothetical protein